MSFLDPRMEMPPGTDKARTIYITLKYFQRAMVLMIGCHQTITYVVLNVSLAQSFENVTTENLSKRNVVCNNF